MKLRRPVRVPPAEPIIALVDVVFFLLVFFMLVARLDATAPFAVAPPVAVTGTDMPGGGVTVSVGRDGALALDGVAVERDGLAEAVSGRLAATGADLVRLNADRDGDLGSVMALLALLDGTVPARIVLVVTPDAGP